MSISKERLLTLSDAIIAIIMTIMVLEIKLPSNDHQMLEFISQICIFFVSFFILANYWWQHSLLFAKVQQVDSTHTFVDIIFHGLISLVPIFTKWVFIEQGTRTSVVSYGILTLVCNMMLYILTWFFVENEQGDYWQIKKIKHIFGVRFVLWLIMSGIIVAIGYFDPKLGMIAFIGIPIISFTTKPFTGKRKFVRNFKRKHRK